MEEKKGFTTMWGGSMPVIAFVVALVVILILVKIVIG